MKVLRCAILLAVWGMATAWPVNGAEPRFRADFDDNLNAAPNGNAAPVRSYGTPRFRPGVRDSAVRVDRRDRVEFSAEGNLNGQSGTLCCYWAPDNWTPGTANFAFAVTLSRGSGDDMLIYKVADSTELACLVRNAATGKIGRIATDIATWGKREFHQLAVTWDQAEVRFYVDGVLQGQFAKFEFPEFTKIILGTPYAGWAKIGDEAGLIDALALYDTPLTAEELRADLAAVRQREPEDAATAGKNAAPATFYAAFEQSPTPDLMPEGVSVYVKAPSELQWKPGLHGRALTLGGATLPGVSYRGAAWLSRPRGTLAFWFKPEWPLNNDEVYFLAGLAGKDGRALLYKPHESADLALLLEDYRAKSTDLLRMPVEAYRPGDWIMLALSWDEKNYKFYINGELVGSAPNRATRWDLLQIGALCRDWPATGRENTMFDELRGWDRTLSGAAIRESYEKELRENSELRRAAAKFEAARAEAAEKNLALQSNGGMLIASTFGNYTSRYSDNLIDNDPSTVWGPFDAAEKTCFLELRFPYPRTLERLSWQRVGAGRIAAARLQAFRMTTGEFEEIKKLSATELQAGSATFPAVTASRFRLLVDAMADGPLLLSELGAYGPGQVIPGKQEPYWSAWYIWHREAGNTYYPGAMRYLRTEFELKQTDMISAVIQSRSNDYYQLWLNDQPVDRGSVALNSREVRRFLRPGRNVLAVETKLNRHPGQWGWGEFLTELAINYPTHSLKIGSGPEWRSSEVAPDGWRQPGFDDSAWSKVVCFGRPPEGPWGKISYTDSAPRARAKLLKAVVPDAPQTPGTELALEFQLAGEGDLDRDYFFTVTGGYGATDKRDGDYDFHRKLADCRANGDGTFTVNCRFELPPWTPGTAQPLRLAGFHRTTGVKLQIDGLSDAQPDQAGTLNMRPAADAAAATGTARMVYPGGQAGFEIDGKIVPPLMWRAVANGDPERIYLEKKYGGINLKNIIMYGGNIDADAEGAFQRVFATLDRRIRTFLAVNPEGRIIVLSDLRPTVSWLEAHPDARLRNAFGKVGNIVSFGSEAYYAACRDFMLKLIAELQKQPYYEQIVGFQPWTCGVPDSCMGGVEENTWQTDRSKLTVGDYNPEALDKFREFLKQRYHQDSALLQAAWRRPGVTFATATPEVAQMVAAAPGGEVLRDPKLTGAAPFDYADFLPTLLGNFQRRLLAEIKRATDRRKMTFVHYGFIVEQMRGLNTPAGGLNDNNYDLAAWLRDDNIDGYIGAPAYNSRFSGQPHLTYFPWSSFALYNRMYLPDDDTRYFQCGAGNYGHNRSLDESRAIIRRNVGADITRNFGSWFADMSLGNDREGVSWTGYREISEAIGAMAELYRQAQQLGYRSAAEIAVIVAPESMKYLDVMSGPTLMNSLITKTFYDEIFHLGAPFDVYMQSDLVAENFPRHRYKLYIMLNSFAVAPAERRAIAAIRATRSDTVWLWMPFSGYVDPERGNRVDNIRAITDVEVGKIPGAAWPRARFAALKHPLLANGLQNREWMMPGMTDLSLKMHPNELAPQLRVTDSQATVLAHFADGGGALALRESASHRSVYSAIPYLEKTLLRNILRYAGVHVYTESPVVFDADARFIVLNNGNTAPQSVRLALPRTAAVITDALDGRELGRNQRVLTLELPKNTTVILRTEYDPQP